MKETEANKATWGLLAKDHYEFCKKALQENTASLGSIIESELGDISGKSVIHLQCNAGADTILLAKKGAVVTGVDFAEDNIFYAKKMSEELGVENIDFIVSDIMEFKEKHDKKYDIVFTTEGVLCWLPDLKKWAETVRHLLKENGYLYVLDSHPFYMVFDHEKLIENKMEIKYPYFIRDTEHCDSLGGWFSNPVKGDTYEWNYRVSDLINSLVNAGLTIEFFNEYDTLFFNAGGMEKIDAGRWHFPFFDRKLPFVFSLKARLLKTL